MALIRWAKEMHVMRLICGVSESLVPMYVQSLS
jgi:hypothetical protein